MLRSFVDDLSEFALSLSEQERKLFSAPFHWALLGNGDADFHDNVIFFGFNEQHNDPVLVAKVPRLIENGWMLKMEYDHLVELWNCIGEEAVRYVPKAYGMVTLQERPALVISYIPGESVLRIAAFLKKRDRLLALAREAALALRDLNRLTARPIERGEAPVSRFSEKANKFRELFPLTPREDGALSDLVKRVESGVATASHKVLIQGDFWHGNMIRDKKHGKLMLVDWQFAHWTVDVSMDVYFFLLAAARSGAGRGTGEQRAKVAFRLLEQWRADIIPAYLSTYGKPEHYLLLPLKYGMLLCCVEKAIRPSLEFGYSNPDDAMWRSLFGELMNWPDEEGF